MVEHFGFTELPCSQRWIGDLRAKRGWDGVLGPRACTHPALNPACHVTDLFLAALKTARGNIVIEVQTRQYSLSLVCGQRRPNRVRRHWSRAPRQTVENNMSGLCTMDVEPGVWVLASRVRAMLVTR